MGVQWTKEQLEAIQARGSNILVAAAAGSGKTAVLVERIIQRICDEKEPVSVDRLLVLTFTEAAAAEMKRKIANAIYERLQQEPENPWLQKQNTLVHSAHISTIHSFCKTMIQNNIHQTQIPTDFSLIDPAENEMLRNQALDKVLERYYQRIGKKEAFRDLAIGYGGIKSDENLRSTVLSLHTFVRSLAYPERWLRHAAMQYEEVRRLGGIEGTSWEEQVIGRCRILAEEALSGYETLAQIVKEEVPVDLPLYPYFLELPLQFQEAYAPLLEGNAGLREIRQSMELFQKGRAAGMNKLDERTKARIEFVRKKLIKQPLDEMKDLLESTNEERVRQMIACAPRVRVLKQLVRQTERLHQAMKRERSALDFNDLEHELLALLADKKGNPTPLAAKLKTRFTEILVDEYQDTNDIQDTIFRMLSQDEKNIFMVGDLKQCIYQFRNANPGIFAEKYHRYLKGDGGRCIRLFKNFRSRKEVIDCVNGIFASLMTEQLGGISYTEEEYLIQGADYPDGAGNVMPELLVTDSNSENYDEEGVWTGKSAYQLEAETVARRIGQMVGNRELLVTDKETGAQRPVQLGDITILMQTSTHMQELSQVLAEHGIATTNSAGQNYLDSLEVQTVMHFLQVIANPLQDIPLLAVLRSAMFDFSADELAEIRLAQKGHFYLALSAAAEAGNVRAKSFLELLNELREDAADKGVDALIWKICHELHFMALVGAMPGGKLRQENLNMLYEHGATFEQGTQHGLFHFIAYIETLRDSGTDTVAERSLNKEQDVVSISTIHRSKGLEYPVVILFGMQQYFPEGDAAKAIIWDEASGIAMDFVDTKERVRYTGLAKKLTREHIIREQRSEEMRLLYVALTRAKEKLILSCTVGKMRNQWKDAVFTSDKKVAPAFASRSSSMRDWVLSALMPHPEAKILREWAERLDVVPDMQMDFSLMAEEVNHETHPLKEIVLQKEEETILDTPLPLPQEMAERLQYQYPHQGLGLTPVKLSISEMKRRQMPEEEYVPGLLRLNRTVLTESGTIGAAEIGTIHHYVLQHLGLDRTETSKQVEEQLDEMVKNGLISQKQREVLSPEKLYGFFAHPLGRRMKNAKEVQREFDFYMEIPASEVAGNLPEEDQKEPVLLQGIADCFFYEEDGVVLVDYKTDRIGEEQAKARAEVYRTQMECYERGLNKILPYPIKEKYLYFLHPSVAVQI